MREDRVLLLLDQLEDAGLLELVEEDRVAALALAHLRHL